MEKKLLFKSTKQTVPVLKFSWVRSGYLCCLQYFIRNVLYWHQQQGKQTGNLLSGQCHWKIGDSCRNEECSIVIDHMWWDALLFFVKPLPHHNKIHTDLCRFSDMKRAAAMSQTKETVTDKAWSVDSQAGRYKGCQRGISYGVMYYSEQWTLNYKSDNFKVL